MKVMVVDIARCNGCYNCQIACKDEHVGNDWAPIAKPQPDTGQFWMRLEEQIRGTVPKVRMTYIPHMCQHCDDAPCLSACEQNAIFKREDGAVVIDTAKCTGQKRCIDVCPYGVIYFNQDLQLAQKCTWCAHLLDRDWKEPRCVDACPTGALKFGEEEELKELIAKAEILKPETNTNPRTYYMGLPKRFVAGEIYDPEADECLAEVNVALNDGKGKKVSEARTDSFGDFWLEGLEEGQYTLLIEKDGYLPLSVEAISTEKDVNVGSLELHKK
jgi:tetrathionate reductase subunit B